jgi:hypothetical protein
MPLSEHEKRVLTSLEESLQSDAQFVSRVGHVRFSVRRRQRRLMSAAGFVLGTVVMVAFYTRSITVGILGAAMMTGSALHFVSADPHLDRHPLERPTDEG